jgi:hypothetical protein
MDNQYISLQNDIRKLTLEVERLNISLNSHIGFIEAVYTSLAYPLQYLKNSIEYMTGVNKQPKQLPEMSHSQSPYTID